MLIPSRAWGFLRAGLNGRYGVRLADAPTGGDFPPLISYVGVWTDPQDAATEVVFVPESLPAQGTLTVYADSSYTHGPITGSDPWTVRVYYVEPGANAQEATGSPATITDSGGSGSYSVSVSEAASAAEALAAAGIFARSLTETATAGEAVSAVTALVSTLSEALSAADSITVAGVFQAAASETASSADQPAATRTGDAAVAEAASASEQTNWGGAFYTVDLAEAASVSDAVTAALQALAAMSEAASAGDAPTVILTAGAALTEAASAAEAITGTNPTSYSVAVSEAGSSLDTITVTLTPGGLVVLSAPPTGRRLQTVRRPVYVGGTRGPGRGGTR